MTITEAVRNIYNFIFILRMKIKLLSEREFEDLLKELDFQQKVYALYLRYY